jgi:hypothetical protein
MEFNYVQNQKIEFNIPGVKKGTGKVVGCAQNGSPIIGKAYIIEPDTSIANETYPFSHFVCFESHLKSI